MMVRRMLESTARGGSLIFALAITTGTQPALAQNGEQALAYPAKGITVDGNLADWPKDAEAHPIARVEHGDKLVGNDDLTASFRAAFDASEHALYVAIEVKDNSIVADTTQGEAWNNQDGSDIFVQVGSENPIRQYSRWGDHLRKDGELGDVSNLKVAVARESGTTVYEYRVDLGEGLHSGMSLAFDATVNDKDGDGSFSWLAWGSGTSKLTSPERCGELLLVESGATLGEVSGKLTWKNDSKSKLPSRVRIKSTANPEMTVYAKVDAEGNYKTKAPVGSYSVSAVDTGEVRVEESAHIDVEIKADAPAKADALAVVEIPWPGLIGDEGVLVQSEAFDAASFETFVKAYLAYFKIPGASVAIIKDGKTVYANEFGLRNAKTKEPLPADATFEAASMTKPLFGYVVLKLVDQKVIDLDTPLYTYLPYEDIAHDDRYKLITARMVLTHRTGFPNWREGKLSIGFTPGTKVSYSGEGFVYLGKVVEKLTGKTIVELCKEHVFTPFEMENASLVWTDRLAQLTSMGHNGELPLTKWHPETPNVAASLNVDAKNYAKFLINVMKGTGLKEETSKDELRSQVAIPDAKNASWGLGISIEESPFGPIYGHGGRNTGFTSHSAFYKDKGFGYVFLINNDEAQKFAEVLIPYLVGGKASLKPKDETK